MKYCKYVLVILVFCSPLTAENRFIPDCPEVQSVEITFNKDFLKGFFLLLDFRTDSEKTANLKNKSLDGPVILFLHGHAQRPDDTYNLTGNIARFAKSGIVIIPVCYTPFGKKPELRGDNGKDIILMDLTEYVLNSIGMTVRGYKRLTPEKIRIESEHDKKNQIKKDRGEIIPVKIAVAGWSHGSLLARRLAHFYPDAIISLAQATPAGYEKWGGRNCTGPACLFTGFAGESSCISLGIFRGEGHEILDSSTGITKGLFGDTFRSCSSCISGNFSFCKLFRSYRDIQDCSIYADDTNFPVNSLKKIVVIFGRDDSLFEYGGQAGIKDWKNPTKHEKDSFWKKFYPGAVESGAELTLKVLPGNHIGPSVNYRIFSETILKGIGQYKKAATGNNN